MNPLTLPEPIAAHAEAEHRPHALALCFLPQAALKSDGHTYAGFRPERGLTSSLETSA